MTTPRLVEHPDRPESLSLQQAHGLRGRGGLRHGGHAAAGEHSRQPGRALERQVGGEPVALAGGIVIHRAEPGCFEPPRGPRGSCLNTSRGST
jgi:hypothetical protein